MKEHGGLAVAGELDGVVADVEQLGGDVSLPEASEALRPEDVPDGGQGALVYGPSVEVSVGEGI